MLGQMAMRVVATLRLVRDQQYAQIFAGRSIFRPARRMIPIGFVVVENLMADWSLRTVASYRDATL